MDEVSRVIGALEAGQAAQAKAHESLATKVDSMDGKLDLLLANQEAERAKRKVWAGLRTAAASAIGGAIGWGLTIWAATKGQS